MPQPLITPVILSGGSGTRLWPLSRPARPKQFHALAGAATMLQMTAARVADSARFAAPVVVANAKHRAEIEAQLAAVGISARATIFEPAGRNTAAAIALAAIEADEATLLLVMPSDHVIGRDDRFHAAVATAAPHAQAGHLVTFGIEPTHADTGYGYIKRGAALSEGVFAVERFVEKPDRATAEHYLQEGGYSWNGGIFLFRADRLLAEMEAHAPDILAGVCASMERAERSARTVYPDAEAFAAVRSQSIDHAVMEPGTDIAVVPVDMGWSDIGSWDALYDVAPKDAGGNALAGAVHANDGRNCLLYSDGPMIVAAGVEDLIVVATGDAVLILPRGQSQRVKELVERLPANGR